MQWLRSFSLNTLAFLAIAISLVIILISNPPTTKCDAEKDNFRAGMVGFFSLDPKAYVKEAPYFHMKDNCIRLNGPGGCLEFFTGLRKMILQLSSVSESCLPDVGELPEVKGALKSGLDLMIRMAWGAAPPQHPNLKAGWFDPGDLALFCSLKSTVINVYGQEKWAGFQNSYLSELPGAKTLPRQDALEKSILSLPCSQYQ